MQQRLPTFLTYRISKRQQRGEIAIARVALAVQQQPLWPGAIRGVANANVGANERLDAGLLRPAVKLDHAEQVALIRQCDGRHAVRGDSRNEGRKPHR